MPSSASPSPPAPLPGGEGSKALRILFVTETYPPEINGVAMTTSRLVEGLRRRGHWVGLVRPRRKGEAVEADTWTVPGLPIPNYPGLNLGLPAWRQINRLLDEQRPDLIHVATEGPLGWAAVAAARRRGLPLTSGYHTHFDHYSRHYGLGWLTPLVTGWLDALHRRCQATLVPTPELARTLSARGIPNVQAIGRGVDTVLFNPDRRDAGLRAAWGLADDDLACLYVGRLAPEKNLEAVERTYAAIAAAHPRARMVWVGDGPSLPRLKAAHPDHLFAGPRIGEDLACHYASADLFLFASLSETWGNVVGEAMASGLAVLAYRHAAAAILIRAEENGMTVAAGDIEAYVAAATDLAAVPALRRRYGCASVQSMQSQSWETIVERFESTLRQTHASKVKPRVAG